MIRKIYEALEELEASFNDASNPLAEILPGLTVTDAASPEEIRTPALILNAEINENTAQPAFPYVNMFTLSLTATLLVSAHDITRENFLSAAGIVTGTILNKSTKELFAKHFVTRHEPFRLTRASFDAGTETTAPSLSFTLEAETPIQI